MNVIYDAGVLVAADRNDRKVWAEHRARLELGQIPTTTAPVVAQVSRGPRQVPLHRFLRGCDVIAFAATDSHDVGKLLAHTRTADVVDAHVVVIGERLGATIITSDPRDLRAIARHVPNVVRVQTV